MYKKFDKFIKEHMKNSWETPGLAICIFDSEKILYKYISGYADLGTKRKLKESDKFCIASASKSYICAAIASLIEKKKIPNIWEMTLYELWSKDINNGFKNVKLKHLANHTSGLPGGKSENMYPKKYNALKYNFKASSFRAARKKLANMLLKNPPIYKPETNREYSNFGYAIIGAILEKLTNKEYYQIIDEEIMIPLNIHAEYQKSFYGNGYVNGHYIIYADGKITPLKKGQHYNPLWSGPGGRMWMSIIDSAKYCQSYLKSFQKNSILKLSTVRYLTKNIKIENSYNYGYGWFSKKHNNINVIYHGGAFLDTISHYRFIPEKNIGIVICTNYNFDSNPMDQIINEFMKSI